MAIFEEQPPHTAWAILLLLAVFALAYPLWNLGSRELFWNEGEYAAAAMEQHTMPPLMTVHGQVQPQIFPLYPLLARTVSRCGVSMEFALRLVPVLALLLLTALVGYTCWRADGPQAGAAGATAMLSTLIVAEKAVEGYPHMLTVLILYAGWLLWFNLGLGRGRWDLAWISTGLFAGLAFYNEGLTGLVYFLVPLFLQRRPMTIWNKMRHPGFFVAVFLVLAAIFFWWIPYWNTSAYLPNPERAPSFHFVEYLTHLAEFPFDFLVRLLPWSLLLWAPFCAALIPLDRNPLFGKFHRILLLSLGLLIWLNPESKARDLLFLTPLAATMAGLHYWIVIRRYGYRFLAAFQIFGWILLLLTLLAATYILLPDSMLLRLFPSLHALAYRREPLIFCVALGEIAVSFTAAATAIWLCRARRPVWMVWLLLFASMMLLFWAVVNPYRAWDRSKTQFAGDFRQALDSAGAENSTLYKDATISGLYPEGCYMNYPIRTADLTREIPDTSETVYVIATGVPAISTRNWTQLYDRSYKGKRLYLYKGLLRKEDFDDSDDE